MSSSAAAPISIVSRSERVDALLTAFREPLGADFDAYRGHVHRVITYAMHFLDGDDAVRPLNLHRGLLLVWVNGCSRLPFWRLDAGRLRRGGVHPIGYCEIGLPMLDRMYKEYPEGDAPAGMERVAESLRRADGFVFVSGEYNWGMQPGLKNLTDHFLEEWFWRPAAVVSYSAGRLAGARASYVWHPTLAMGMVVVPGAVSVPQIGSALDEDGNPRGEAGQFVHGEIDKTIDTLAWWGQAARDMRAVAPRPS